MSDHMKSAKLGKAKLTFAMSSTASLTVQTVVHPLRPRILEVRRSERIGPRMQRIVLGGAELGEFPFPAFAPADHVKIVVPDAEGRIPMPTVEDDRLVRPSGAAAILRDYTVRSYDADAGELVLDFVRHDHGPGGRWGMTARPGDRIGVLGPRGSHLYPRDYERYVLIADESALPAVGRWLDEPELRGDVIVIAAAQSVDEYPLPARPGSRVEWIIGGLGDERGERIAVAAAAERLDAGTFVWAAAEAQTLKPLRRMLKESPLNRDQWDIDGYWKQGIAGLDHHLPDDD